MTDLVGIWSLAHLLTTSVKEVHRCSTSGDELTISSYHFWRASARLHSQLDQSTSFRIHLIIGGDGLTGWMFMTHTSDVQIRTPRIPIQIQIHPFVLNPNPNPNPPPFVSNPNPSPNPVGSNPNPDLNPTVFLWTVLSVLRHARKCRIVLEIPI